MNEFWVSTQRTEASERCGLAGSYWLKAEKDTLILKEPKTKRNILVWPYKLLRRYGRDRVGGREKGTFLETDYRYTSDACRQFKFELQRLYSGSANDTFSCSVCSRGQMIYSFRVWLCL